jgi:hypothetical protein
MLIQKLKDLGFQGVVHEPSLNYKSRATPWPMARITALMQVNTAHASAGEPTWDARFGGWSQWFEVGLF